MITVAGFNTAIDVLVDLDVLQPGAVHRCSRTLRLPGGKGLHVAQTIAALGEPVQLVGLVDAAHRERIESHLHARGVAFHGIEAGRLRECLALRERDGRSTELLEPGPELDAGTCARLRDTFLGLAAQSTLAVLSGSLPRGCDDTLYADMTAHLQTRGVRCLVDASGEDLQHALAAAPHLVKPNRDEAHTLLQRAITNRDDAIAALQALRERGVALPLLSLAGDGALLADGDEVLHGHVELQQVVNGVGSGDCMLAGLAVALARGDDAEAALRLGVACGAANAMGVEPGFVRRADVDALLPRVSITRHPPASSATRPHA